MLSTSFRWTVLLALLITLAAAPGAQARRRVLAPPGNSAINQYVEVIPTASGGRPASTLNGGGGMSGPGERATGGSSGGPAGSGLPARTATALARQGPDGTAVASLVRATSPSTGGSAKPAATPPAPGASSAPATVLKTLVGSSPSGGLGLILPILLGAAFIGAGLLALRRRRAS